MGAPILLKPWRERQQLTSRPEGNWRQVPTRPGRTAAAREKPVLARRKRAGRLWGWPAGRPPGGGFAAVWRFCHISDSQKGRVGRTQLFLAETARTHAPCLPVASVPCALTPGLPVTGASPGPSGQRGLSEGPARSWLPRLHLALGRSRGAQTQGVWEGGGPTVLSRRPACHLPGTLIRRNPVCPRQTASFRGDHGAFTQSEPRHLGPPQPAAPSTGIPKPPTSLAQGSNLKLQKRLLLNQLIPFHIVN